MTIAKRVKPTDLQTSNIILDYSSKKVEKCVVEGKVVETDWDRMNNYYKKIYPNLISQLEKANETTSGTV